MLTEKNMLKYFQDNVKYKIIVTVCIFISHMKEGRGGVDAQNNYQEQLTCG